MCGRYTLTRGADDLVEAFGVPALSFDFTPSYNIAPGRAVPVLARDRRGRRIGPMVWGLVPAGSTTMGRSLINARAETVADRKSFRDSFVSRRCLVPADGFYEWKGQGRGKTPFWFHGLDGGLFTMAAVWDRWRDAGGMDLHGFAILTRTAGPDVALVHEREPVVIEAGEHEAWLERTTSRRDLEAMLRRARGWAYHAVDRRVGSTREDDPMLTQPL
jgi:putative SOS response-associated peptidase YedK